jgi:hypothetical protein
MTLTVNENGLFMEMWATNKKGERVYPCLQGERGSSRKGFNITLTGKKEDYHLVDLDRFLQHIADGDFAQVGRVRMAPEAGGQKNGFSVKDANVSKALHDELDRRRRH